jgi:hypothetical protein
VRNQPGHRLDLRRLDLRLLVLLAVVGVNGTLAGGALLWQRQHAPLSQHTLHTAVYQQVANAPNTGASILYLSSPSVAPAPAPTKRTMCGARATGDALALLPATGGHSVDGQRVYHWCSARQWPSGRSCQWRVYFVTDSHHLDGPNRGQALTALRADDSAVLW